MLRILIKTEEEWRWRILAGCLVLFVSPVLSARPNSSGFQLVTACMKINDIIRAPLSSIKLAGLVVDEGLMKRQATAQSQITMDPDWPVHQDWQQRGYLKHQRASLVLHFLIRGEDMAISFLLISIYHPVHTQTHTHTSQGSRGEAQGLRVRECRWW